MDGRYGFHKLHTCGVIQEQLQRNVGNIWEHKEMEMEPICSGAVDVQQRRNEGGTPQRLDTAQRRSPDTSPSNSSHSSRSHSTSTPIRRGRNSLGPIGTLRQIQRRVKHSKLVCNLAKYRLVFFAFGWQCIVYAGISAIFAPSTAVLCDTGPTCNPLRDWCLNDVRDGQRFKVPISSSNIAVIRRNFAVGTCLLSSYETATQQSNRALYRDWSSTLCAYWNETNPTSTHSHLAMVPNWWVHDRILEQLPLDVLSCQWVGLIQNQSSLSWWHEGLPTNQYFQSGWDVSADQPPHDQIPWSTHTVFKPEPDGKDDSACMYFDGTGLVGRTMGEQRPWICQYEYNHDAPYVFRRVAVDQRPVDDAVFQWLSVARGIGARHACHLKCGRDRMCRGYSSSATLGQCLLAYDVLSDTALQPAAGYVTYERLYR